MSRQLSDAPDGSLKVGPRPTSLSLDVVGRNRGGCRIRPGGPDRALLPLE